MSYPLAYLISLPVSMVILLVSMVAASAIAGGIGFGSVRGVLLKAVPLLLVTNALAFVPYGDFLAIPVWWVGLMWLFRLDFWEAKLLVAINWVLNLVAHIVLLAILVQSRL